jgi:hypothetical protein
LQEAQPSLAAAFPSSQDSPPRTSPSPQIATHALPNVGHIHPGLVTQFCEHPSPASMFPSSQVSFPSSMPLPHERTHTEGSPLHANPG